jgi:catechol 2,3-dioxygenase-like lactoylglutathione lyase family enzyme
MATKKKTRRTTSARATRKTPARKAAAGNRSRAKAAGSAGLTLQTAGAAYTVNDIERSLAWYRDVLGCAVGERWESAGKLEGVEMKAGKVSFMLTQDDWKKGRDRVKGEGFRLYCTTGQDVDRQAERIKARGGRLLQEPTTDMGMRGFAVADPDGFKIAIQTPPKR